MEEDGQGACLPLYSERLLEHFRNPRRAGAVDAPAADVRVENMACGDRLRLTVQVEDGVVTDAAFQAQGCTASIACGSALAEWLVGKRLAELKGLTAAGVEELVDGLPAASKHAAALCAEGVREMLARIR